MIPGINIDELVAQNSPARASSSFSLHFFKTSIAPSRTAKSKPSIASITGLSDCFSSFLSALSKILPSIIKSKALHETVNTCDATYDVVGTIPSRANFMEFGKCLLDAIARISSER